MKGPTRGAPRTLAASPRHGAFRAREAGCQGRPLGAHASLRSGHGVEGPGAPLGLVLRRAGLPTLEQPPASEIRGPPAGMSCFPAAPRPRTQPGLTGVTSCSDTCQLPGSPRCQGPQDDCLRSSPTKCSGRGPQPSTSGEVRSINGERRDPKYSVDAGASGHLPEHPAHRPPGLVSSRMGQPHTREPASATESRRER